MSYCSPQWVSDWTYIALFNRAKVVSSQPYIYVPPELLDRSYDRIKVIEDQAWIKDRKTLHRPPDGEPRDVIVTLSDGSQTTLSGHYFAYNHFEGGLLYVMRPANWGRQLSPVSYTFQAEGRGFVVANH